MCWLGAGGIFGESVLSFPVLLLHQEYAIIGVTGYIPVSCFIKGVKVGSRVFTRVNVSAGATICIGSDVIQGVTENLSLQGFYLRTSKSVPLNQPITVTLYHAQATPVQVSANVVRQDASGGLGVRIDSIDVNSFVNLRNVITQQCHDFNSIMSETYRMVDCIH
jgi:hypothetical protein